MSEASRLIRDSIAALPDDARKPWEKTETRNFYWVVSGEDGVARWSRDVTAPEPEISAIAAHVALLASPDVATALADLLDAITDALGVDDDTVKGYAEALDAAITRAGGS